MFGTTQHDIEQYTSQ